MAKTATCPDCSSPMYRYAKFCNACKAKGSRNSRYGKPVSEVTKDRIRQKRLARERKPCRKRNPLSVHGGRLFARRWFPMPAICEHCGLVPPLDRHHKDGNTQNNDRSNIAFLCRACHQKEDGRYEFITTQMPSMGGFATAKVKRERITPMTSPARMR